MAPLRKNGIGRLAFRILAYGVPALFLTLSLQKLGGTALWIPVEWRHTITLLSLGAGMACFQLARGHKGNLTSKDRASEARSLTPVTLQVAVVTNAPSVSISVDDGSHTEVDLGLEPKPHAPGERRGHLLALVYLALMAAFLVPQLFLRFHCLIRWNPADADVRFEWPDPASVPLPGELVESKGGFHGSVLVPPRSWLSAGMRKRIDGRGGVRVFMDGEPVEFIESLAAESRALWMTVGVIVLVHLGVLLSFSAAYGYSFNLVEEVAQLLPGLG